MRNALKLPNNSILTIDNAGCLGELVHDVVACPNEIVSYFTARTALFEQLCAGALPHVIALANFTGDHAWDDYVRGIARAYEELGLVLPRIVGSTESNFTATQSGISLTLVGDVHFTVTTDCQYWYVVGVPLVGPQVLQNPEKCAPLGWIYEQLVKGVIQYVHPVGSGGIRKECSRLFDEQIHVDVPMDVSGGPATAVIVGTNEPLTGFKYIAKIDFPK